MGITDNIAPAIDMLKPSSEFLKYAIWLLPLVAIAVAVFIGLLVKKYNSKKFQWTHKLKVRRVLEDGVTITSEPIIHKMRRFQLINGAEVFELEKALLGSYLFPELDKYSGDNEFSIILDNNNRIYTANRVTWEKDKGSMNVSAKHSEIDLARKTLKEDFRQRYITNERTEDILYYLNNLKNENFRNTVDPE